jgi:glycosyltransferase involved in cell wall biosynthesis
VFVANSNYVARRILKAYGRQALVIPPPVAVHEFTPGQDNREGFLAASRFVPYKRVELIAEAFRQMPQHKLTIVGTGTNAPLVEKAAAGATNITLLPPVKHAQLVELMRKCRAMVFAAEEDFGITMVEAQACGTPVIGYCEGGGRDIIDPAADGPPTGILFSEQTIPSLISAVESFCLQEQSFSQQACRENAMRFSEDMFKERITSLITQTVQTRARL